MLLKPIKAFLVFFFFFLSFLSLQLGFDLDREVYPLVVHAVVDEGDGRGALCHPPHTLPSGGTRPGTFPAGVGQQALTAPPQAQRTRAPSPAPGAHEDAAGFQNGAPRDGPDGLPDGRASGKVGGRHGALRALLQPRAFLSFRVFRPLPRTAGHFRKGTGLTSLCLPVLPFAVRPLFAGRLSSAASGAGWGSGGVPQGS